MTSIALFGMAPLPCEQATRHHAPGIRSWQLARPLLRAGHRVRLLLRRYPEAYPEHHPDVEEIPCPEGNGTVSLLTPQAFEGSILEDLLQREAIDCLVGVTIAPAARAARLACDKPFYADLHGHTMGEAQAKAAFHGDDSLLLAYFQQELSTLTRADRLAAVSHTQQAAVLGELGLLGRLNSRTTGYPFVDVIPCSHPGAPPNLTGKDLRGESVPEEAFVILHSGGYNTWCDIDTLFHGLEEAMDRDATIHFLSTGGELKGQDEESYPRFCRMVEGSRHRDRFRLLGWIDASLLPSCYLTADIAINADRDIAESWLGGRNRIPVFQSFGLSVVTTPAAEVSRTAQANGAAHLFPAGDVSALAGLLARLAADRIEIRAARPQIAAYANERLSPEATASPLLAFAKNPSRAPDAGHSNDLLAIASDLQGSLDSKDRRIAEMEAIIANAERHIGNLEALQQQKDAAIQELRTFETKIKKSAPYRLLQILKGKG